MLGALNFINLANFSLQKYYNFMNICISLLIEYFRVSLSIYPEQKMLPGMLPWHAASFWKGLGMPKQHAEQYVPLRDSMARNINKTQFLFCVSPNFRKLSVSPSCKIENTSPMVTKWSIANYQTPSKRSGASHLLPGGQLNAS